MESPLLWGRDHIHRPESAGQPMVWRRVSFKCSLSLQASVPASILAKRRSASSPFFSSGEKDVTSANFHFQAHTILCWALAISLSEREFEIDSFSLKLAPRTKKRKLRPRLRHRKRERPDTRSFFHYKELIVQSITARQYHRRRSHCHLIARISLPSHRDSPLNE